MALPVLVSTPNPLLLSGKGLEHELFAPHGTVIAAPLPKNLSTRRCDISSLPSKPTEPVIVNQGYAIKYSPVSPVQNHYAERAPSGQPASSRMSLFSCFPRTLRAAGDASGRRFFDIRILERHPYTSQTFIPLSTSSRSRDERGSSTETSVQSTKRTDYETLYMVVVAPTLTGQAVTARVETQDGHIKLITIHDPPDLSNIKAFFAKPGQAVTYAAGTWHAPMVVLGKERVDFVVTQFMNGIEEEDCQLLSFNEGIAVDLGICEEHMEKLAKL